MNFYAFIICLDVCISFSSDKTDRSVSLLCILSFTVFFMPVHKAIFLVCFIAFLGNPEINILL